MRLQDCFDLQVHSTFSDGEYTPLQLMHMAKQLGMLGIVITDHNTIAHFDEARNAARHVGLETLDGIEITTNYYGVNLHILGYATNFRRFTLRSGLRKTVEGYERRILKILNLLKSHGIELTLRDIRSIKPKGELTKFDIYRAVQQKYPRKAQQLSKLLTDQSALNVPYEKCMLSPAETIRLIHRAGGVAILAHPADGARVKDTPREFFSYVISLILTLKRAGLDGIEVYSSHHTHPHSHTLLTFAKKNDLLITGGSDFHGSTWHSSILLGSATATREEFQRLIERARIYKKKTFI